MKLSQEDLMQYELFPVGNFETLPVDITKNLPFELYPNIVKVFEVPSPETLHQEYLDFRSQVNIPGNRYVRERLKYFKLDPRSWSQYFSSIGFNADEYATFSMRCLGTSDLRNEIGSWTKRLIQALPVKTFRQQYAVAKTGWSTQFHIDTNRLDLHGFRVMIPLNAPFEIEFEDGYYRLNTGAAYFVNVSKLHKGLNTTDVQRCNIMLHMASDKIIDFENRVLPC